VTDGLFSAEANGVKFHGIEAITEEDFQRILQTLRRRITKAVQAPRPLGARASTGFVELGEPVQGIRPRLTPPPRLHHHRYHGVFAPNAPQRGQVTALVKDSDGVPDTLSGVPVINENPKPAVPSLPIYGRC
jgi:hypothetical protein